MNSDEFLRRLQTPGAPTRKDAERVATAVLSALSHLAPDSATRRQFITQLPVSPGELQDFEEKVPKDIAALLRSVT